MPIVARNALVFAAVYAVYGMANPFMPLWLKAKALPPDRIALILACPLLLKIILGPILARFASSSSRSKIAAISLLFSASALYAGLNGVSQTVMIGALFCCATFLSALVAPILDGFITSQPLEVAGRYAFVRSFGSMAYIAANVCGGAVVGVLGSGSIAWIVAILAAMAASATLLMAESTAKSAPNAAEGGATSIVSLLKNRQFVLLLITVSLSQLGLGYYGFAPLIWSKSGFSPQTIGILWGAAVVSEVIYFQFADRLQNLVAPGKVLIIGAVAVVCRALLLGLKLPLPLVCVVQILQVAAYSAPYLASIQLVSKLVPPQFAATAQTIRWALTAGAFPAFALLIGGTFEGQLQERGYWVMAPFGLLALGSALMLNASLRSMGAAAATSEESLPV
jgi:MFS transporter, PPP family, 3-phenylpropionic acid transporter